MTRSATREVNHALRRRCPPGRVRAWSPHPRGRHNLAVGLTSEISITIDGNAGYFLGGLCGTGDGTGPDIVVDGFVGWSVGENLMGGVIRVRGSASQSAGSSARGGLIVDRRRRLAAGGDLAQGWHPGHRRRRRGHVGFMAQAGTILIGGNAGHGLGDSLYEAVIYVAGTIASLGADAVVEEMTDDDVLDGEAAGRGRPASTTSIPTG